MNYLCFKLYVYVLPTVPIVLIEFMYLTVLPTNSPPPPAYAHKLLDPFPVIQYSTNE